MNTTLRGSPLSGGYAGSKLMQLLLTDYTQQQPGRLKLNIHFLSLAPLPMMPGTEIGKAALEHYAAYLNMSKDKYMAQFDSTPSPEDAAREVVCFAEKPPHVIQATFLQLCENLLRHFSFRCINSYINILFTKRGEPLLYQLNLC